MRILIVDNGDISKIGDNFYTDSFNGKFINDLRKGEEVEISYFQFYSEERGINSYCLNKNYVKCYAVKPHKIKLIKYLVAYFKLFVLIQKHDFTYFYFPGSLHYGILFSKLIKKKYGIYIRGEKDISSSYSQKYYKDAEVIFTVSNYFTDYVNKACIEANAETIKPMIQYNEDDIIINRKYSLGQKINLLYLGRIVHDKGIGELLLSIKKLISLNYNINLVIVGSGNYRKKAIDLIEELEIQDYVKMEGPEYNRKKIKEYYIEADFYILPTYHEGFPRTLYEAMIFGTPIITTFVGGIPTLMKDRHNCIRIEPKSCKSIVDALEYGIVNYEKMKEYALNASKMVENIVHSSRKTHGKRLLEVLQNI